jgi:hypothetical protein
VGLISSGVVSEPTRTEVRNLIAKADALRRRLHELQIQLQEVLSRVVPNRGERFERRKVARKK